MGRATRSRRGTWSTGEYACSNLQLLDAQSLIKVPVFADSSLRKRVDERCRQSELTAENTAHTVAERIERRLAALAQIELRLDEKRELAASFLDHLELANAFPVHVIVVEYRRRQRYDVAIGVDDVVLQSALDLLDQRIVTAAFAG